MIEDWLNVDLYYLHFQHHVSVCVSGKPECDWGLAERRLVLLAFLVSRLCLFLRKPERDWGLAERRLVLLAFSASCLCSCLREARTWLKTGRNCCRFGRSYLHRRMICERGWSMRASVDVVVDWYVLLDHIISLVGRITCTKCKEAAYCYQWTLVCGSLPVSVCFFVCVCWLQPWAVLEQPNQLRCRLGCGLLRNHLLGVESPRRRGSFGGGRPSLWCSLSSKFFDLDPLSLLVFWLPNHWRRHRGRPLTIWLRRIDTHLQSVYNGSTQPSDRTFMES